MRSASVLYKDEIAGILTQQDDGTFTFAYTKEWLQNSSRPAISMTLPKSEDPYHSSYLFPFFYHMLPEGTNREVACRQWKIDHDDDFGLLLHSARFDTIGAVTIEKIEADT